jgi:hypothetical protein
MEAIGMELKRWFEDDRMRRALSVHATEPFRVRTRKHKAKAGAVMDVPGKSTFRRLPEFLDGKTGNRLLAGNC